MMRNPKTTPFLTAVSQHIEAMLHITAVVSPHHRESLNLGSATDAKAMNWHNIQRHCLSITMAVLKVTGCAKEHNQNI